MRIYKSFCRGNDASTTYFIFSKYVKHSIFSAEIWQKLLQINKSYIYIYW